MILVKRICKVKDSGRPEFWFGNERSLKPLVDEPDKHPSEILNGYNPTKIMKRPEIKYDSRFHSKYLNEPPEHMVFSYSDLELDATVQIVLDSKESEPKYEFVPDDRTLYLYFNKETDKDSIENWSNKLCLDRTPLYPIISCILQDLTDFRNYQS